MLFREESSTAKNYTDKNNEKSSPIFHMPGYFISSKSICMN